MIEIDWCGRQCLTAGVAGELGSHHRRPQRRQPRLKDADLVALVVKLPTEAVTVSGDQDDRFELTEAI